MSIEEETYCNLNVITWQNEMPKTYWEIHIALMPCIALIPTLMEHCKPCFIHSLYFHSQCPHLGYLRLLSHIQFRTWHVVEEAHVALKTRGKPWSLKGGLQRKVCLTILFYKITKIVRAFWLVKNLWFTVPVNS